MDNTSKINYSIIIPVYNEQDNLIKLRDNIVSALETISGSYQVLLIDDGSTDGSRDIIKNICSENGKFQYLFFDQNHGQTAAFDAGFRAASGEVIITLDADLQVDAHDIPKLLEHIGDYDMVVGYREKRADNLLKRISSVIANNVRNWLSGEDIRDVGCPLKVMRKEVFRNVKLYEGLHRFFPTLAKLEGYTVIEVPVNHYPRLHGNSKYNIRNRLFKSLRDLFAVRWMKKRYLRYKIIEKGTYV